MNQEKAAKAHIDFLIDDNVKEELGITGRTLSQQVLRLCGGFNDLVEKNKALIEAVEARDNALKEIIPILGDVDRNNWPVPQQKAQSLAIEVLGLTADEIKSLLERE